MSESEKNVSKSLTDAFNALPSSKKEYLMGFADGVNAMKDRDEESTDSDQKSE